MGMTDRELLELSAKAAGINLHVWGTPGEENFADMDALNYGRWNPLTDDGDALRLAVKLNIDVTMYPASQEVGAVRWKHNGICDAIKYRCFEKYWTGDPCAATRRAIVRAAAEIGKGISQVVRGDVPEDNYYKTQAEAEELVRAEIQKQKNGL